MVSHQHFKEMTVGGPAALYFSSLQCVLYIKDSLRVRRVVSHRNVLWGLAAPEL